MVETNVSQSAKAAGKDVLASAANITGNTAKTVSNLTDAVVKFSDIVAPVTEQTGEAAVAATKIVADSAKFTGNLTGVLSDTTAAIGSRVARAGEKTKVREEADTKLHDEMVQFQEERIKEQMKIKVLKAQTSNIKQRERISNDLLTKQKTLYKQRCDSYANIIVELRGLTDVIQSSFMGIKRGTTPFEQMQNLAKTNPSYMELVKTIEAAAKNDTKDIMGDDYKELPGLESLPSIENPNNITSPTAAVTETDGGGKRTKRRRTRRTKKRRIRTKRRTRRTNKRKRTNKRRRTKRRRTNKRRRTRRRSR